MNSLRHHTAILEQHKEICPACYEMSSPEGVHDLVPAGSDGDTQAQPTNDSAITWARGVSDSLPRRFSEAIARA